MPEESLQASTKARKRLPAEATLVEAHHIADELEKLIAQRFALANVVIHVDPYDVTKEAKGSGGS